MAMHIRHAVVDEDADFSIARLAKRLAEFLAKGGEVAPTVDEGNQK